MMHQYWENVWNNKTITEYLGGVYGLDDIDTSFLQIFKEYGVQKICDAACGYGRYSVLLSASGFDLYGFDIAGSSIHLTKQILHFLGMEPIISHYTVANILETSYSDGEFDAVVAHAVIDHLPPQDSIRAFNELIRITHTKGLIYLSFSGSNNTGSINSTGSYDGRYPLQALDRDGLLYRYYTDEEIHTMFLNDVKILRFEISPNGDRNIVLQK